MALKAFKKTEFKDKDLTKFQENVQEYLNQLDPTFLNGRIIKDVLIGTTTTNIAHGLARAFQGFIIIDKQTGSIVWRDATSGADLTKFLPLKASAAVTVSLWVF